MPRRGRGVDFAQRFTASRWAEDRLLEALQACRIFAVRIGLSEVVPGNVLPDDVAAYKVPDLLVYGSKDLSPAEAAALRERDLTRLEPDELAPESEIGRLLRKGRAAFEVEFSPYRAKEMSGRNWTPRERDRLERRAKVAAKPRAPVAPNIYIKDQDIGPLLAWQRSFRIPIVVVHLFDQEAFAVRLDDVVAFRAALSGDARRDSILQQSTGIFTKVQDYDRTDAQGARESKPVFQVTPSAAVKAGEITGAVVKAQLGLSSSKKYVAQVVFEGGTLNFDAAFLRLLADLGVTRE